LYSPGEKILNFEEKVEHLVVVSEGHCNLYGKYYDSSEDVTLKVLLTTLPKLSWFGDY